MAYINGKKIMQVVKTEGIQHYKHSVKMQGTYESEQYTIYAEIISTDGDNWATEGYNWSSIDDLATNGWEGIIAGYNRGTNYQYMTASGSGALYQSELYYDIENRTAGHFDTIDASELEFIEDTVTPI